MIIPINLPSPGTSSGSLKFPPQLAQFGSDEVVLVELQGSLEVEGNKEGQVVGKLRVDDATKKPTMLIGHHLLEGKLVNLPKPLAIIHRQQDDSAVRAKGTDEDTTQHSNTQTAWDVMAIVKRKMVFSKRPMPMVGKVAAPGT